MSKIPCVAWEGGIGDTVWLGSGKVFKSMLNFNEVNSLISVVQNI